MVYDLNGLDVAILLDRDLPAGYHAVDFKPEGLPSGIYLARFTSGKLSNTIKLVYLK